MLINLGDYQLQIIHKEDNYLDTIILYNDQPIGILNFIDKEEIFLRQIRIEQNFKRKGHATKVIQAFERAYHRDISLCIAQNSPEAVGFWRNYLESKTNASHVRGSIYRIQNT